MEKQTSIKHSRYLKELVEAAKRYVPKIGGRGVTNNDFYIIAAGMYATHLLKRHDVFEQEKRAYIATYGMEDVQDFDTSIFEGEAIEIDSTEENPLVKELTEG